MAGSLDVNISDITYGDVVGQGSLGDVYKAKHKAWGPVYIRRMEVTTTISQSSSTGRKLIKEAEILTSLRHKNIVQMIGIIWNASAKHYALVFEPARYGFLSEFLLQDKNRGIPMKLKIAFMFDIALGLSYLHSLKVIHRDLRWQNIQVMDHLVLKIADYGLAEWVMYTRSHSSGRHYQGPTYHIPPERWRDINLRPDEKTDVYSYAMLCWTIVAQEEPFKYADTEQIRDAVMRGQRPSADNLPTDSPPDLWQWLQSWWHNNPLGRPPIQVILEKLEELVSRYNDAIEDVKIRLISKNKENDGYKESAKFSACDVLSQNTLNQPTQGLKCDLEVDADESPENNNSASSLPTFSTDSQAACRPHPAQNVLGHYGRSYIPSCTLVPSDESIPSKETGNGTSEQCIGSQGGLTYLNNYKPTLSEQGASADRIRVYERSDGTQKTKMYTFSGVDNIQIGDKNVMNISTSSSFSIGSSVNTRKKKTKKLTVTSSKKKLDEINMDMLKRELGKDWKNLARKLDFCEGEIDAIEHDNQGLNEQIHQLLRKWIDKNDNEATLCAVADALIEIKKYEIAAKLKDH